MAGLKLSLFISITKNNFRFLTPRPPPREADGSLVNVIVVVFGVVAYFMGRSY